jgi:hypothetical protein
MMSGEREREVGVKSQIGERVKTLSLNLSGQGKSDYLHSPNLT